MTLSLFIYGVLLITSSCVQAKTINHRKDTTEIKSVTHSTVELKCKLTYQYGSDVIWRKLEGRMSDDSEEFGGKLILSNVKLEDSGVYECYLASGETDRVKLNVYESAHSEENNDSSERDQFKAYIEKAKDENVEINCNLGNNQDIDWKKINGKLSEYSRVYGSKLLIYYLNEEDSGTYECSTQDGRTTRVVLKVLPSKPAKPAKQQKSSKQSKSKSPALELQGSISSANFVQVNENENIELVCKILSEDENLSLLKWRRVDGEMSPQTSEYENVLTIYYAKKEDEGEYECYLPDTDRSELFKLTVKSSSDQYEDISTLQGSEPDYYEDGVEESQKPNPNYEDEPETTSTTTTTEYPEEANEDNQSYNNYEDTTTTTTTSTYGHQDDYQAPEEQSSEQHESYYEKYVDETVEMSCGLREDYGNSLKWRRTNDQRLSDYSNEYDSRLSINYLTLEDAGEYECYLEDGRSNRVRLVVRSRETENDDRSFQPSAQQPTETYVTATIQESSVSTRLGNTEENTCFGKTDGEHLEIIWTDSYDRELSNTVNERIHVEARVISTNPLKKQSILRVSNIGIEDDGVYHCKVSGNSHYENAAFRLNVNAEPAVDDFYGRPQIVIQTPNNIYERGESGLRFDDRRYEQPRPQPQQQEQVDTDPYYNRTRVCDLNEATCSNGQCIPRSGLCNGVSDCADDSDESKCGGFPSQDKKCQPNEKECRNGKCAQKIWFCDGENDCGDNTDEQSCPAAESGEVCKSHEFLCRNRNQCIFKSFLCDKEFDCLDHSDEIGCEPPRITMTPIRFITVFIGESFTIECHAEGFPIPFINWRLNWGHTCEEPRCYSTNRNGRGTFTVTDAQLYDAGAYSCEAISSEGRVFATPDTIVDVLPRRQPTTTTTTTTTTTPRPFIQPTTPPEVDDCFCHNHTFECTCSGRCFNCTHNTYGDKCQYCLPGFYGDATRGTEYDCVPEYFVPPSTTTTTTTTMQPIIESDCACNGHSNDCTCSGICLNCQHNTMGRNCELCKPGYIGDPATGPCLPSVYLSLRSDRKYNRACNPYGTQKSTNTECRCKHGVTGEFCDQCLPRSFNLVKDVNHKRGCMTCFCNGMEVECSSSNMYYNKIESNFNKEGNEWILSDKKTELKLNLMANHHENSIEFNKIMEHRNKELFFIAPQKYRGNKLASYGGNLTFTIEFSNWNERHYNIKNLDIRIAGHNLNIQHIHKTPIVPNVPNKVVIPLIETEFQRYGDNQRVDRDHFLITLSDIKMIMISATYSSGQYSVKLSDLSLDYADINNHDNAVQAVSVEICQCPVGYTGTSCETCAPGYKRLNRGFYLGLCEKIN